MRSELFYELTTPVYSENTNDTIYLNPIDYSAILPFTIVRKKGGKFIPLLLFNLLQTKYEVTLGESSLLKPYREFLMNALFAQCNRSSCFNLKVQDKTFIRDSALILEIKVKENLTTAKMAYNNGFFINPFNEDILQGFSNWELNRRNSWLEISARLSQQDKCLWEKTFTAILDLPDKHQRIEVPKEAYYDCIDEMTECLSNATKVIVENISQYLHLMMLQKQHDK
jgi:hypothetical protein